MKANTPEAAILKSAITKLGIKSGFTQMQQAQTIMMSIAELGLDLPKDQMAEIMGAIYPFLNASATRQFAENAGWLTKSVGGAKAAVDWSKLLPDDEEASEE